MLYLIEKVPVKPSTGQRGGVMEVSRGVNGTLSLEGRGRVTRCLSVYTTPAASSPASGTVWQNDPGGRRKCTVHSLFICSQFPVAYCEPHLFYTDVSFSIGLFLQNCFTRMTKTRQPATSIYSKHLFADDLLMYIEVPVIYVLHR